MVFKSRGAESVGQERRNLNRNLTIRGQTWVGYGESYSQAQPLRWRGHREADQLWDQASRKSGHRSQRAKFELNSTCGWHRKTQGRRIKWIKSSSDRTDPDLSLQFRSDI
jgi:hypothetical protein